MGPVWSLSQTQDETMPCLPVPWEGRPSGHCWQLMDSIFPLAGPPADCVILGFLITTLRPDRRRNSIKNSSLFADENHSPHKSQKLTLGGDWMNAVKGMQAKAAFSEGKFNIIYKKRETGHMWAKTRIKITSFSRNNEIIGICFSGIRAETFGQLIIVPNMLTRKVQDNARRLEEKTTRITSRCHFQHMQHL